MNIVTKLKSAVFVLFVCFVLPISSTTVFAGNEEYRQCGDNEPCKIGEYLFDDSFTPITTASCTLSSRNPDGNIYLNQVPMTAASDGWYELEVTTAGQDYGLYRSQICCSVDSEYICIDKSFEIATPSGSLSQAQVAEAVWDADTASHNNSGSFGENLQNSNSLTVSDIWAYPQRTLTSFGTLTADIWSYSSRSLNNLTSLISGIWSGSDRTLTANTLDSGELATKSQVESSTNTITNKITDTVTNTTSTTITEELEVINQHVRENRNLLEKLVNSPIVETFIEDGEPEPTNLQSKIQETKKIAKFLSADTLDLKRQILALNTNWENTSYQIALSEMNSASRVLGASTENIENPSDINSRIAWLNKKWDSPIINNLATQNDSALANVNSIDREVKSYGKTFISKQYLDIASEHVDKLASVIGEEKDSINKNTLFGYIANLELTYDSLVKQSLELDEFLQHWDKYTNADKDLKLARISKIVLSANHISGGEVLLQNKIGDDMHRENLALALQGLINSNLILLAHDSNETMQNIWLEHGSVIFRSLVSNPSTTIKQEVDVRYYLPQEISQEHIIKIDDQFKTVFDPEKNSLFVEGKVMLDPGETKTFVLEVVDIWIIPEEEIASIRKQTNTLFDSLKNTSYFAQGSTIKADIEVNLDKIAILQKNTQTPEMKIKAHREAMLELDSAKSKLDSLKTIVSSAGSVGTVFGFVGGVQTIAVWGLIIILVAGFVFLSIYLKMISSPAKKAVVSKTMAKTTDKIIDKKEPTDNQTQHEAIKRSVEANKNESTLELLKDIIVIKLNLHLKSSKLKKNPWIIRSILGLMVILIITSLIIVFNNNQSAELINPYADLTLQNEYQNSLDEADKKLAASTGGGMVLGDKTKKEADQAIEDELELNTAQPIANEVTKPGHLVMARIPQGYEIINVRAEPRIDSEVLSRLWANQKVLVLEEQDGWVYINTIGVNEDIVIKGWITKAFTSELEK